jgi:hypothetical protein
MNASQLQFTLEGKAPSQTDRFIAALLQAGGNWVGLPALADLIGGFAVHSRAADARKKGYTIENRTEHDALTGKRHSFYRLVS